VAVAENVTDSLSDWQRNWLVEVKFYPKTKGTVLSSRSISVQEL
jgi:hypothetical protein